MDGHSSSGPVTVLLLAALTSSALGQDPLYFPVGESLVLSPPEHGSVITSVVWTHNTSLLVEWVGNDTEFFRSFKGRTSLNESTAQLTINDTTQSDGGEYRVEINNRQQSQVYRATVIKKVPKPSVVVSPPSCNSTSSECNFTCEGDPAGTGPLTYSWRKDLNQSEPGLWELGQRTMKLIGDTTTKRIKHISCSMKNPVSEEESDRLQNPMYPKEGLSPGELAACICFSIIVVVLIGLGVWKREAIKKRFCAGPGTVSSGEVGSSGSPSVNRPLNEKPN